MDNRRERKTSDLLGRMFENLQQIQCDARKINSNTDPLVELEKIASGKGFVISDNEGSGNCMFHALSEQLNLVKGTKISHKGLRQSIVQYLLNNPRLPNGTDLFNFIHGYQSWPDYLTKMEQDGTWGDHVILYATANCYKTHIHVISSQSNHRELTIKPDGHVISTNPLVLGHVHEFHYVSLQPKQDKLVEKKRRLSPRWSIPDPQQAKLTHENKTVAFKKGRPGDLDLDELAGKIPAKWQELGLRLGISQDKLDEIEANEKRKAYRMLLHWRNTTASATLYHDLYYALCDHGVGLNNVAKEFCDKTKNDLQQIKSEIAIRSEKLGTLMMQRETKDEGHTEPCDLPEDAQDGSVSAAKDGTAAPSHNLDVFVDVKNKMPSGNNTPVNVFINCHDLSQIQRGTDIGNRPPVQDQGTSTTELHLLPAETLKFACIPQGFRTRFLGATMSAIPIKYKRKICMKLDSSPRLPFSDWRMLAEKIGVEVKDDILWFEKRVSPTKLILQKFEKDLTVGRFKAILEKQGRYDVVTVIEDWILDEWRKKNNNLSSYSGKGPNVHIFINV